jgi:hypothetical protein
MKHNGLARISQGFAAVRDFGSAERRIGSKAAFLRGVACQLSPAADIPAHSPSAAMCQLLTHALQQMTGTACNDLLDHLIGAQQQASRHFDPERPGRSQIND